MNLAAADPNKAISEPTLDEDESTTAAQNKDKHFQDTNNDEILVIPDLDEDGGADGDQRVAHAPRNFNRKVPTLGELENDVKAALPTSETGLDMTVLFKTLVPASQVQESDVPWNFDSLLREVTEELLAPVLSDLTVTAAKSSSSRLTGKADGEKKKKSNKSK